MRIKSLQFKNFASYGNRIQNIEFEKGKGDLYLVLGNNGVGKSTLARVMTYLCYGRVEGVNLRDLPNRVNSGLWGKIHLESKGKHIEIERGIAPSIFNVKINGEEYDVAGKSNMQDFLETEMYEIPYHVFKNVIILSVNDFKSFITMSPHDKKMIVDRIFGFSVINDMREIVKQKRREIIDEIRTFDDEIRTLDDSIRSVANQLEKLEKENEAKNKAEIKILKEKLIKLGESKKKLVEANNKIKDQISKVDKELKEESSLAYDIKSKIRGIQTGLKLYEQKACPTCSAPLDSDFHTNLKQDKLDQADELKESFKATSENVTSLESKMTKLREQNREIISRASNLDASVNQLKEELVKLAKRESNDSDHLKTLVKQFGDRLKSKKDSKNKIEGEDYYLTILENMMGDDGIKNMAIRSVLPSLNNNVTLMAKEMGIPFGIRFDEKFNCTLHHLGEEISPKTLSTGEKKKVDFVVIMSLIKMIKIRFPSLNILFLDEIFSSIDADGVYHIVSILHNTIQEIGLNTFVINHTVLPSEYFDKKLEISKDAGFSEFNIETIG